MRTVPRLRPDDTDEDVFGLTEGRAMGVRVGHHSESRAQYYVTQQGEMEEVIRFLVRRIDRTPESLDANDRDTRDRKKAAHEL